MLKKIESWISRHRIVTSFACGMVLFSMARPTFRSILIGLPAVLLGEAIRIWSSGHIQKDRTITIHGPYAFSRNPLYLGNFFIGLGVVLMGARFSLMVVYLFGFYWIYRSTIEGEEGKLSEKFGESYRAYCRKVPRWLAFPRNVKEAGGEFRWEKVIAHREYNTWLGILGVIGVLVMRTWFH